MRNRRVQINLKAIGSAIILFAFLQPEYFTSITIIHMAFNGIRILGIFIVLILVLKFKQIPFVTLTVCLYYFIVGVSTYINLGDISRLISDSLLIIGFVLWVELLLKNFPLKTLQILNYVFSSLTYANVIFFLIFPNGYENYYSSTGLLVVRFFLGVYNQFAAILIPAVVISVIYSLARYNRVILSTKILILTVLFTFIYFWSATSILGIVLIILYLLLVHKGLLKYFINYKVITVSFISLFVMIVFFNNLELFSFVIEDILNKDLTLSTRTRIWDVSIQMISLSPILGYGYLEGGNYIYISERIQRNAHNMFLQIVLQGGILSLSTFILLIIMLFRRISKYKNEMIVRFILFSVFTSFVMMLSEVYSLRFIYILILLGVYVPNIINSKRELKLI